MSGNVSQTAVYIIYRKGTSRLQVVYTPGGHVMLRSAPTGKIGRTPWRIRHNEDHTAYQHIVKTAGWTKVTRVTLPFDVSDLLAVESNHVPASFARRIA